jgi:hypothetical protein
MGTATVNHILGWELPAPGKAVLVILAHHLNDHSGICHPSIETLAAETCLHRATVIRAVAGLRACGAVEVRKGPRGAFQYTIPQDWTGRTAQPVAACDGSQGATQPVAACDQYRSQRATQKELNTNEHQVAEPPAQLIKGGEVPVDDAELIGPVFILRTGVGWRITKGLQSTLASTFTGVDIDAEIAKAATWCETNPGKRKTANGMPRFLNGWLTRTKPASSEPDYNAAALALCRDACRKGSTP